MAAPFPFSLLEQLPPSVAHALRPPPWVIDEVQQRLVLLLNHVLMQEPEACARLQRHKGRQVQVAWRDFDLLLQVTPAGLFERGQSGPVAPDLRLTVTEPSPWVLAQTLGSGGKPPVRIEGDVQFAAEINWLVDHVRWDLEEDLARLVGDAPAHAIGRALRAAAAGLRQFVRPAADAADRAAA